MATSTSRTSSAGSGATRDRNDPLRQFLEGVLASGKVPKRADIQDIELVDDASDSERRDFVSGIADYCRQIVKAVSDGDKAGARNIVADAVEEYGDLVDAEAMADKEPSPRVLALGIPRGIGD